MNSLERGRLLRLPTPGNEQPGDDRKRCQRDEQDSFQAASRYHIADGHGTVGFQRTTAAEAVSVSFDNTVGRYPLASSAPGRVPSSSCL